MVITNGDADGYGADAGEFSPWEGDGNNDDYGNDIDCTDNGISDDDGDGDDDEEE